MKVLFVVGYLLFVFFTKQQSGGLLSLLFKRKELFLLDVEDK
jgi:hypothetical protein